MRAPADPVVEDVRDAQTLNRYSYVYNNPLSYTDPTGYVCHATNSAGPSCIQGNHENNPVGRAQNTGTQGRTASNQVNSENTSTKPMYSTAAANGTNSAGKQNAEGLSTGEIIYAMAETSWQARDWVFSNAIDIAADMITTATMGIIDGLSAVELTGVGPAINSGIELSHDNVTGAVVAAAGVVTGKLKVVDKVVDTKTLSQKLADKVQGLPSSKRPNTVTVNNADKAAKPPSNAPSN